MYKTDIFDKEYCGHGGPREGAGRPRWTMNGGKKVPQKYRTNRKNYTQALRKLVVDKYGGKCVCCGESNIEFLCMDHIGGKKNHPLADMPGNKYSKIIKLGYPDSLRLLCHNCNMSLAFYGYCPHDPENMTQKVEVGRKKV